MLSEKAVRDFQRIYKKEFGIELSYEDASEQGVKLLRLFSLIFTTIPKEWLKQSRKRERGEKNNGNK